MITLRSRTLLVAVICMLLLTGCWDQHELDTISIVTGVGLDATQDMEEVLVTIQAGKTQSGGEQGKKSGDSTNFYIQQTRGRGINAALDSLKHKNSRIPYLHHNQVLVIGREQANKGIGEYLDAFMREHEMRMEVWMFIADEKAEDILMATIEPEQLSSLALARMMYNETMLSKSYGVNLMTFVTHQLDQNTAAIIPIVELEEVAEEQVLLLSGLGVFKDGRMVGQLSQKQINGYIWLMGQVREKSIEISSKSGYADVQLENIQTSITPIFNEEIPRFHMKLSASMSIGELQGYHDKTIAETVDELEKATVDQLEKEVQESLTRGKELNADIFDFAVMLHQRFPKKWKTIEDKWMEIFPLVEVTTQIEVQLTGTGKAVNNLKMKVEQ